jgi:hypothetical protein
MVVYGVVLAIGRATLDDGDATWLRWAFAGGTIAAALFSLSFMVRATLRTREVDRVVITESASLAFAVTMVGAVTYGLLESLADLPRLSAWATWTGGMGAWLVASLLVRRARL